MAEQEHVLGIQFVGPWPKPRPENLDRKARVRDQPSEKLLLECDRRLGAGPHAPTHRRPRIGIGKCDYRSVGGFVDKGRKECCSSWLQNACNLLQEEAGRCLGQMSEKGFCQYKVCATVRNRKAPTAFRIVSENKPKTTIVDRDVPLCPTN